MSGYSKKIIEYISVLRNPVPELQERKHTAEVMVAVREAYSATETGPLYMRASSKPIVCGSLLMHANLCLNTRKGNKSSRMRTGNWIIMSVMRN